MSSSHLTPALTASTATQRRRGAPWRQPLTGLGLLLALVILALWWTSRTPIVDLGSNGKARILGQMNANEWRKLVASAGM